MWRRLRPRQQRRVHRARAQRSRRLPLRRRLRRFAIPAPPGAALISGFEFAAELPDGRWLGCARAATGLSSIG